LVRIQASEEIHLRRRQKIKYQPGDLLKQLRLSRRQVTFAVRIPRLRRPPKEDKKEAHIEEIKAQAYVNNIVKPITDILGASYPACVSDLTQLRNEAIVQAALVSADKIEVDNATKPADSSAALAKLKEQMKGTIDKFGKKHPGLEDVMQSVLDQLNTCPGRKSKPTPPIEYDPFDLVSQTINFYITSSGSVTPTWKLVNVSAPLNGTLVSGSRKDTNTLIIAFGRPDLMKGSTLNTAISNQILTSTLKDALSNVRITP
jgi:hypothetical protein